VPITGRPSECEPNVASWIRSWTSSCGWSSYIAISSSTTSRSASTSANCGAKTISPITSSAVCSASSGTRAKTTVCSREVAAFSSPPSVSKISAISCAEYVAVPLKSRCSMKWETPARAVLLGWPRRSVLRPLDQLLGLDHVAVLVLGDELEADPATVLVDFLHEHVQHVAARDHVLDVADATWADVGDVQQPVRPLRQL